MLSFANVREQIVSIAVNKAISAEILQLEGEKEKYVRIRMLPLNLNQRKLEITASCFLGKNYGSLTFQVHFDVEPFALPIHSETYFFKLMEHSANILKFPRVFQLTQNNLEEAVTLTISVLYALKADLAELPSDPDLLLDSNLRGSKLGRWSAQNLNPRAGEQPGLTMQLQQWANLITSHSQ